MAKSPDLTAVPVGAFADLMFVAPQYSAHEERAHKWLSIAGDSIEHFGLLNGVYPQATSQAPRLDLDL